MTTILTKKKDTSGAPGPGDLTNAAGGAELAVNTADKRLYTKNSGGNVVEIGTNPTILNIDNIQIDVNTISSTNTNGDIIITPNGTGSVVVSKLNVTGAMTFDGNVTVGNSSADTLVVNSTITSNLIFTDNTYDIGASGATRPRNLYLAGNAVIDGSTTLSGGTANGVLYLNGSKVATSGSALTFDGTNLAVGTATANAKLTVQQDAADALFIKSAASNYSSLSLGIAVSSGITYLQSTNSGTGSQLPFAFYIGASEQMRLTSTGLGIGTSSPGYRLDASASGSLGAVVDIARFYADSGSTAEARILFGTTANVVSAGIGAATTSATDGFLKFYTESSGTLAERMRLDSSGNLGLGVTPSAWYSAYKAIELPDAGFLAFAGASGQITSNAYYDGAYKYKTTAVATQYAQSLGQHQWFTAPSGTAGNAITFSQVMTLDASGNLGLGVTPSAWASTIRALEQTSGGVYSYNSGATYDIGLYNGCYYDGAWKYKYNSTAANAYFMTAQSTGFRHVWRVAPASGVSGAGTTVSFNDAMVLDSSGNLGVGQTSPLCRVDIREANRGNTTNIANVGIYTTNSPAIDFGGSIALGGRFNSGNQQEAPFGSIRGAKENSTNNNYAGYLAFQTIQDSGVLTERARITSGGAFLFNTTSSSAAGIATASLQVNNEIISTGSTGGVFWENRSGSVTSNSNWYGWYTTSNVIYIYSAASGNVGSINASTGVYTALSDRNKKKDFEPSTVGLDAVSRLKPTLFRMLDDADDAPKQLGFIAQDVADVIPQAYVEQQVTDAGGKESTYIGLNDRPIIAALVKAIQEQQALITSLTARVALLEGN